MASADPAERGAPAAFLRRAEGWRGLVGVPMVALVWAPIALVGVLHYTTPAQLTWVHDVLRRMYYLPILFGAFVGGLRGGLLAAAVVAISYTPHAFLHDHVHHADPARGVEKMLELLLYFVVAGVAGRLADLERQRRQQLQRALDEQRSLTQQLVRAGRLGALGEVVAGIAHEIKNPLHALKGSAEIVDAVVPRDCEERRLWEIHRSELTRLGEVAERFLSFARPTPPQRQTLDLREVATRVIELAAADARQHGVTIATVAHAAPLPVSGDRDQLAQIGLNILINGLRALGEHGGQLRVATLREQRDGRELALLQLENDGPLLDPASIEHLFDPFFSGHDEGTGLGLSISARIAEQHDGFIEAANAGIGVRFTLYLPLDVAAADGAVAGA